MEANAGKFARISLHFMLDPVQLLEYETGQLVQSGYPLEYWFSTLKSIHSKLTYACQTWIITVRQFDKVDAVYNQFPRSMIRNGWARARNVRDSDETF